MTCIRELCFTLALRTFRLHKQLAACASPVTDRGVQVHARHLLHRRSAHGADVPGCRVVGGGAACAHAPRAPPTIAPVATGHHDVVSHHIEAYHALLIIRLRHGYRHLRWSGERVPLRAGTCNATQNEHCKGTRGSLEHSFGWEICIPRASHGIYQQKPRTWVTQ